ncbi:ferritin-like domain-containing protein, partial [Streptomyces sp. NPDC001739]
MPWFLSSPSSPGRSPRQLSHIAALGSAYVPVSPAAGLPRRWRCAAPRTYLAVPPRDVSPLRFAAPPTYPSAAPRGSLAVAPAAGWVGVGCGDWPPGPGVWTADALRPHTRPLRPVPSRWGSVRVSGGARRRASTWCHRSAGIPPLAYRVVAPQGALATLTGSVRPSPTGPNDPLHPATPAPTHRIPLPQREGTGRRGRCLGRKATAVHEQVQAALEVEHLTIPVYMTGMYSLHSGTNRP